MTQDVPERRRPTHGIGVCGVTGRPGITVLGGWLPEHEVAAVPAGWVRSPGGQVRFAALARS